MENGYVILFQADVIDGAVPTRLQLFHIATGRWIVATIHEDFVLQLEENPGCVFGRVHLKISQSHMIQILDGKHMAFFKLPDPDTPVTRTPYILSEAPTHIVSFPGPLYDLTVLPQSDSRFGLMAMEPDKEKPVIKRLRLLTFDLSGHGPEPVVRELDSVDIGTRHCRLQTIVMSCGSLSSNTFLGVTVMGAEIPGRLASSADSVHRDHRQLFLVAVRISLTERLQADSSDDPRQEPNIRLTVLELPEEIVSSCKGAYLFHFNFLSGMLAVEARTHEGSEARSIVWQYL
ncbi:hypothetical protein P691DRAFT_802754 [Macrolepiota fuliginosa MF-IS2]|uniref:Uncharacterized protein n=1 Tax=Macrolepiota fuliginosa MF-IS2 TaxID=1400762 RepID=A0A9P5XK32_9AGAR|nr:hypothetical protein P691DRAFT_802754 [Macrolepiota fuliginosa MF-IS2]